jgi:hypothetical protein
VYASCSKDVKIDMTGMEIPPYIRKEGAYHLIGVQGEMWADSEQKRNARDDDNRIETGTYVAMQLFVPLLG